MPPIANDDPIRAKDLTELRVLGLERIPGCVGCPRLAAITRQLRPANSFDDRLPGLPEIPEGCRFQFCAPLVSGFEWAPRPEASHAA